jgi:hypothetical protein
MSGGCSKVFGVLFALLFIFASVSALSFYFIETSMLQPDAYLEGLQEGGFSERLTGVLSSELAERLGRDPCFFTSGLCNEVGGAPGYLLRLGASEWEQILDLLVTQAWVQEQSERVVRGVFEALDSQIEDPVVRIELVPIKNRLAGDAGGKIVVVVLNSLPSCTNDQVAQLGEAFVTGGSIDQLLVCSPPPEFSELAVPILRQNLGLLADELPDQIILDLRDLGEVREVGNWSTLTQIRQSARRGLLFSTLIAAVSLLFVFAFTVRSLSDLFAWTGWPFLLTGSIAAALSIGLRSSTALMFRIIFNMSDVAYFRPDTLDFIGDLFQAVIRSLLGGLLLLSIGIAGVGAALLIVSRLVPGRSRASEVGPRPENLH